MPYEFGSYGFHKSDIDVQVSKFIGLALAVPLLIVLSLHATIYHDMHLVRVSVIVSLSQQIQLINFFSGEGSLILSPNTVDDSREQSRTIIEGNSLKNFFSLLLLVPTTVISSMYQKLRIYIKEPFNVFRLLHGLFSVYFHS